MTQGWFTGLIPITVPIGAASFGEAAWAAQTAFDSALDMAKALAGLIPAPGGVMDHLEVPHPLAGLHVDLP